MSEFKPACDDLIDHWEGGFQDNPQDRGNWTSGIVGVGELKGTIMGISAMCFPDKDIKNLTRDQVEAIYEKDWWVYGGINDQAVSNKVFNLAVNWQRYGGHGPAIHILQEAINSLGANIADDGSLGPATIAAANALEPVRLLVQIRNRAFIRYKVIEMAHPEDKAFFAGWEKRALA